MNYGIVARYLGLIALAEAVAMVPSVVCGLIYQEWSATFSLGLSIGACIIAGLGLKWAGRKAEDTMYQREALALVGLTWFLAAGLGALPFIFSGTLPKIDDAFFESMSGFTTTGSSVMTDIESAPHCILFWRSFTQWIGGIGIVVIFVSVLPYLGAGGKQLFKLESPGPESKSFRPRIRETAKFLCGLYLALTTACFLMLWIEEMNAFDAICHTFSCVSTGGFSTKQASVGHFDNAVVEVTMIFFMVAASLNFNLLFAVYKGNRKLILKDSETRLFLGLLAAAIILVTLNLMGLHGTAHPQIHDALRDGFEGDRYAHIEETRLGFGEALRTASFQAVSIFTTTGFATDDYDVYPHFSRLLLLLLMFIGGCGGSTAGGFKIVRIIMAFKMAYWALERSFRPKTIRAVRIGDEIVEEEIQRRLWGFLVLYLFWWMAGLLLMAFFGLPFEMSVSAVLATMNNIGPGLGLVGPTMDFHLLPSIAKYYLSFCMVLGRLEILTISVFLIPSFWKAR